VEVRGGLRSGNKVRQNTFKNIPEDDLDSFFDIISHLMSKYRPDFLELFEAKIDGTVLSGPAINQKL
jgi:hypothetical protein